MDEVNKVLIEICGPEHPWDTEVCSSVCEHGDLTRIRATLGRAIRFQLCLCNLLLLQLPNEAPSLGARLNYNLKLKLKNNSSLLGSNPQSLSLLTTLGVGTARDGKRISFQAFVMAKVVPKLLFFPPVT